MNHLTTAVFKDGGRFSTGTVNGQTYTQDDFAGPGLKLFSKGLGSFSTGLGLGFLRFKIISTGLDAKDIDSISSGFVFGLSMG